MKSNNSNPEESTSAEAGAIKRDALGLWTKIKVFLVELLDFRSDTDRESTIEAIVRDIPFKGATAWILICSIFVASIGLNANSTAVVIGAMLISPLMGPILGIGLSIAINDIDNLNDIVFINSLKWYRKTHMINLTVIVCSSGFHLRIKTFGQYCAELFKILFFV